MTTLLAVLGGALVSVVAAAILQTPVQSLLARLLGGLGFSRGETVKGIWLAKWDFAGTRDEEVTHVVRVRQFGSSVVGRSIASSQESRRATVTANLDGRILTGVWKSDADERALHHGAFQLVLRPNGMVMSGKWVGFDRENNVLQGDWRWDLRSASLGDADPRLILDEG